MIPEFQGVVECSVLSGDDAGFAGGQVDGHCGNVDRLGRTEQGPGR
jgi:hypothetical protein